VIACCRGRLQWAGEKASQSLVQFGLVADLTLPNDKYCPTKRFQLAYHVVVPPAITLQLDQPEFLVCFRLRATLARVLMPKAPVHEYCLSPPNED